MKIQNVPAVYFFVLGLVVMLNIHFPLQIASLVDLFLPIPVNLTSQNFIRYRLVLFLSATIVFLILASIIFRHGFDGIEAERISHIQSRHLFIAILVIPIGWVGYPFMSLCTTCWTSNDAFYFFLTIIFFTALQILFQAIILKITNRKEN